MQFKMLRYQVNANIELWLQSRRSNSYFNALQQTYGVNPAKWQNILLKWRKWNNIGNLMSSYLWVWFTWHRKNYWQWSSKSVMWATHDLEHCYCWFCCFSNSKLKKLFANSTLLHKIHLCVLLIAVLIDCVKDVYCITVELLWMLVLYLLWRLCSSLLFHTWHFIQSWYCRELMGLSECWDGWIGRW